MTERPREGAQAGPAAPQRPADPAKPPLPPLPPAGGAADPGAQLTLRGIKRRVFSADLGALAVTMHLRGAGAGIVGGAGAGAGGTTPGAGDTGEAFELFPDSDWERIWERLQSAERGVRVLVVAGLRPPQGVEPGSVYQVRACRGRGRERRVELIPAPDLAAGAGPSPGGAAAGKPVELGLGELLAGFKAMRVG